MDEITISGQVIKAGQKARIEVPVADLYTGTEMNMPVHIIRAKKPGPKLFVSAAIHGDELNGIEIIRRLLTMKSLKLAAGTLIFVPMVNVYGVLNQSRYLPDRRDLNRSFPGSPKGSLAGRIADRFLNEIVHQCDYGIDLHTGAIHRSNLPQVRANLSDPETSAIAEAFGAPVMLNANLRDGSLRQAAMESGTRILLYEAGEALRFDEFSIKAGVRGVLKVMAKLGMIKVKPGRRKKLPPFVATNSVWVRAEGSGIVHDIKHLGDQVVKGDVLAEIGTPFGEVISKVKASRSGIIIGKQNIPLVQEGEAMFHIAYFDDADDEEVAEHIENLQGALEEDDEPYPVPVAH
ncbi:succinylglutamate desuccinylase/aspartoacylase family protein [Parendozoicomonas haliclonae]|uniref:Succinylglutamate desuccinylase n=1 Tax=Parendozoicomonas haliclonae TaxID=1960125 RepID=A0A1X7ANC7_9GAMM|nr:succinylglutamate desuccinylase/aspartoacylase family protein [Parendozoicomonas haliclonae]SMA49821.1 succinylglutamate desuccinylase [Parendozoicomonas haliclonae]